jgi:hypothetical protein
MPAKVTREQFEIRENEVVHVPTGATFGADPDDKTIKNINSGLAGGMPSADKDYDLKDIEFIAKQLLAERLQRRD